MNMEGSWWLEEAPALAETESNMSEMGSKKAHTTLLTDFSNSPCKCRLIRRYQGHSSTVAIPPKMTGAFVDVVFFIPPLTSCVNQSCHNKGTCSFPLALSVSGERCLHSIKHSTLLFCLLILKDARSFQSGSTD